MVVTFFTNVDKNYSNTEHEVLAVIWALVKIWQEIIVPAKPQQLKWLLSLSLSGRLAR